MPRVKLDRTGETVIAHNGMRMTIINYRRVDDIDVQFEDGTIVVNTRYECFKKGFVKHPIKGRYLLNDKRIGETIITKNGLRATITGYRRNNDIDVEFEDGTLKTGISYQRFKRFKNSETCENIHRNGFYTLGSRLKKERLGETNRNKQGLLMTIVAYKRASNIDVELETGEVLKHREYRNFLKGNLKNIKTPTKKQVNRVGEIGNSKCGLAIKIVDYNSSAKLSVEFEDGTQLDNRSYANFKKGIIAHPKFKKTKEVYQYRNMRYFMCECKSCKGKHVLSLEEMKDFECDGGHDA